MGKSVTDWTITRCDSITGQRHYSITEMVLYSLCKVRRARDVDVAVCLALLNVHDVPRLQHHQVEKFAGGAAAGVAFND